MNRQRIITSAALYFQADAGSAVPSRWLEIACGLFQDRGLPVDYFDTTCGDFAGDDVRDFRAQKTRLIESLERGAVEYLGLGCFRPGSQDVEDWRIRISIEMLCGVLYVGAEEEIVSQPAALLRSACAFTRAGLAVRYGIAYKSRLVESPELYAAGTRLYSLSDVTKEMLTRRNRTRLDAWFEEKMGERRYLTDLFRGAYPASVLSDAHVRRASLRSLGLGSLSRIDTGLWLWELSDAETPTADGVLDKLDVLIK
jgi:hypothetical protein